jgi:hypothetical protein
MNIETQKFTGKVWLLVSTRTVSLFRTIFIHSVPDAFVGLVTYKGCQIPEQLRRYLNGNPKPKDHKEDPSTDGRITLNRIFAK